MSEIKGNNIIEKSRSLVWTRFTGYTIGELRLLEVYLSRINPRDPETAVVSFTLAEYSNFLGIKINSKNIRAQVRHFVSNVVEIPDPDNPHSFSIYPLFQQASVVFDPKTVNFTITLICNPELRPVFFDIAEKGYVKYRLKYTATMKSQYSILLYSMLRDFFGRGVNAPEISIAKLREQLGAKEKSYDEYRYFRKRVLEVACPEINDKTDLHVTYEKQMVHGRVMSVKFKISPKEHIALKEADFKDVSHQTANNLAESEKAVKTPRSAPYEDIEWEGIAPELERASCISIAKMVAKRLKAEYPQIKQSKRKAAVVDTIQGAYKDVLEGREPFPDNPAGYLYSVLNREGVVGDYLPGKYTFV